MASVSVTGATCAALVTSTPSLVLACRGTKSSGAVCPSCSMLRSCLANNKGEAWALLRLAGPVSANYLLNRLVGFTSIVFVGRWGPDSLSAAALGLSLINVIGPGVLNGLTGGMVTLCGQVKRHSSTHL